MIVILVAALIPPLVGQTTGQTTQPTAPTILDSFHSFNTTFLLGDNLDLFQGDTFTIGGSTSFPLASSQFMLNESGLLGSAVIVSQIWNIQGTPGINGLPIGSNGRTGRFPSGSALASSLPFPTTTLTSTFQTITFSFPFPPLLAPGNYAVSYTLNSSIASQASPITTSAFLGIAAQISLHGTVQYPGHNDFTPLNHVPNDEIIWFTVTGQFITGFNIANSIGTVPVLLLFPLVFAALGLVWMWKHGQAQGV